MAAPLDSVAYAKNPAHERFVQRFEGKLKWRYHLAFLVGVEFLGGKALRAAIEQELGNPDFPLNEMRPARDMVVIFDRAIRAGLKIERIGELVFPAYKRAHPELFAGATPLDGFALLERGYREDTNYGGVSPAQEISNGRVRLYRTDSPAPCQYFVGCLHGVLHTFGIHDGSAEEVACQWDGAPSCAFEVRWPV
jgi:hypothetical protein